MPTEEAYLCERWMFFWNCVIQGIILMQSSLQVFYWASECRGHGTEAFPNQIKMLMSQRLSNQFKTTVRNEGKEKECINRVGHDLGEWAALPAS